LEAWDGRGRKGHSNGIGLMSATVNLSQEGQLILKYTLSESARIRKTPCSTPSFVALRQLRHDFSYGVMKRTFATSTERLSSHRSCRRYASDSARNRTLAYLEPGRVKGRSCQNPDRSSSSGPLCPVPDLIHTSMLEPDITPLLHDMNIDLSIVAALAHLTDAVATKRQKRRALRADMRLRLKDETKRP